MTDRLLTKPEVSAMIGVPVGTLSYWRHRHEGPRAFKLGRRLVYKESDVLAWIDEQYAVQTPGGAA